MSSNQDYLTYVLELLRELNGITYKKMMGEYIFYKDGIIFGGIYDNRFLVKKTISLEDMNFKEVVPYPNAKPMYVIDSEDPDEVKEYVLMILKDLKSR